MLNDRIKKNGYDTFAFEQRMYRKLYEWICKKAGINSTNANAVDLVFSYLKYKWGINGALVKSFLDAGSMPREILYNAIMRGFDVSTEMGCYIELYD